MANLGDTYTSDAGAIQGNIEALTGQLTSSIQSAPQVQTAMGESLAQTEGAIPVLASQRAKLIEELFKHDQNFAQQYGASDSPNFIENPVAREAGVRAASAATMGGISGLGTQIASRQQLIGDALTRGMSLYQAGIEAKKLEMDMLQKSLDRLDAIQAKKDALEARKLEADAATKYAEAKDKEDLRRWEAEHALEKQKLLLSSAKGGEMTPDARKAYAELLQAQAAVDELDRLSQTGSKGALGVILDPLSSVKGSPIAPEIQKLKAARIKYAMPIQMLTGMGTVGAGGVKLLSELKDVLPDTTDSEDNRQNKIDMLRQAVANKAETLYTVYGITPTFNPYAYKGVLPPAGGGMEIPGPTQTAGQSPLGPEWVPIP